MAPAQHLNVVTLGVSDLARARGFYVDGLGWEVVFEHDEVVFVHLGSGLLLSLFGVGELAADATLTSLSPGSGSMALAKNVSNEDEVDALVERAVAAGATVVKHPQQAAFGGYHAYVLDPDEVLWEIAYNPGFTVGDDGRAALEAVEP